MSLGASGFEPRAKRTRKQILLAEMEQVVPWSELGALVELHAPKLEPQGRMAALCRRDHAAHLFPAAVVQSLDLSDLAAEEALHDTPVFQDVVGLDVGIDDQPDEYIRAHLLILAIGPSDLRSTSNILIP